MKDLWQNSRYTMLLITLLVLNLARMATVNLSLDRIVIDLFSACFLVTATLLFCAEKRSRTIALSLGVPTTILSLIGISLSGTHESAFLLAGRALGMVFLAYMILVIIRTLMTQPTVTRDHIAGAFCGYVLIGVAFAEAYCLLESFVPLSFQITPESIRQENPIRLWLTLQYFSFTTLTTLGFGDVLPLSPLARGLAVWEAILGQLYLAVMVAGLVNLRASRVSESK